MLGVEKLNPKPADICGLSEVDRQDGDIQANKDPGEAGVIEATSYNLNEWTGSWRGQMKGSRTIEQTPLSIFVRERLAEFGMKQSEFCRLTGFDQGLLSKIQSSVITNLSLETALRLAIGLSVPPQKIFALIGRTDLQALIRRAYPITRADAAAAIPDETPTPVLEVNQLALRVHGLGRSLAPVISILYHLAIGRAETSKSCHGEEPVVRRDAAP